MKNKLLLGIFALTLFPFLTNAGEWEYDASGSLTGLYGYSDVSKEYQDAISHNNISGDANLSAYAKYIFNNEIEAGLYLDLMQGIDHELEDYNQGKWGEEAYGIADIPYGRIMLGQTFNAAYQFHVGAPNVGPIGVNNSDIVDFIANPNWKRKGGVAKYATLNSTAINTDGVAPKVTYITPEFYGTLLGFSYVPESYNRRGLINKAADYHNKDAYIFSVYNNLDLETFSISTSLGYADYTDNDKEFSAGLSLTHGNWSLGGSWRKTYAEDNDAPLNLVVSTNTPELFDGYREGYAWDVGVGYEIGPYKVALSYFRSEADNTDNSDEIITLSNQYQLNKYADIYLAAAHVEYNGASSQPIDSNKGYAFVSGLRLHF